MKSLKDEVEIASVSGTGVSAKLTTKRVIFESGSASTGETRIIPLQNIDSYAFRTSQNVLLFIIGALAALVGLVMLGGRGGESTGIMALLIAVIFLAVWWFTRRIGAFIYSLSGRNEVFLKASAGNRQAVINFLDEVQQALDKK